jgi:hypothetical protein
MMNEIRSVLFWTAVICISLIFLQRGCETRMERFSKWREEAHQQRQERREQREKQSDGERRRFRLREDAGSDPADTAGDVPAPSDGSL